jgi:cobalt/nickel transport protein
MEYKYYLALAIVTPLVLVAYTVALGYTALSEKVISLPHETEVLIFTALAGIMAATIGHFIGTKKGLKSTRAVGKAITPKLQVKNKYWYILIIGLVLAIFIVPFVINSEGEFGGTDGQGPDQIESSGYTPWIEPLGYIPDEMGEIVLFSLQVAIGASIIGYFVGYLRAKPGVSCD